jgi:hypothetical protein
MTLMHVPGFNEKAIAVTCNDEYEDKQPGGICFGHIHPVVRRPRWRPIISGACGILAKSIQAVGSLHPLAADQFPAVGLESCGSDFPVAFAAGCYSLVRTSTGMWGLAS